MFIFSEISAGFNKFGMDDLEKNSKKQNLSSPPRPEFGLRTMANDIQAIRESGGSIPGSQLTVSPSMPMSEPKTPVIPEISEIPGYTGPEESIFQPATPSPSATFSSPASLPKKSKFLKSFLIIIGVLIILSGLGALGYFVVYPLIFPTPETTPLTTQTPTSTPATQAESSKIIHHSLFKTMPKGGFKEITIADISRESILNGLKSVFKPDEITNNLREAVLFYKDEMVNFNQFTKAIFPELHFSPLLEPVFESDFTIFVFKDKKGDWPGFVATIKDLVENEGVIKENLTKLETSNNVKNFYFSDPGTAEGFKDGKIDNINVRYTLFTQPGAAFSYVLKNNLLIVATSYSSLQAAIDLLP